MGTGLCQHWLLACSHRKTAGTETGTRLFQSWVLGPVWQCQALRDLSLWLTPNRGSPGAEPSAGCLCLSVCPCGAHLLTAPLSGRRRRSRPPSGCTLP